MPGVLTPPTAPPICLSIPRNVMQNQYNFCSYLSQSHELWEQADLFVMRQGIFEGKTSQQWTSSKSKFNFHIGSKLRTENWIQTFKHSFNQHSWGEIIFDNFQISSSVLTRSVVPWHFTPHWKTLLITPGKVWTPSNMNEWSPPQGSMCADQWQWNHTIVITIVVIIMSRSRITKLIINILSTNTNNHCWTSRNQAGSKLSMQKNIHWCLS